MDDAFRMVAAHVPRTRRLTPFAARAIAMIVGLVLLVLWFSMFVVSAQHGADARRAQLAATQRAEAAAKAEAAAAVETADPAAPDATAVGNMLDARAEAAATAALDAARRVASGSIVDATPNVLTAVDPTALYVEGPSTGPSVVSIYAGAAGWAAAVHGAKNTCYWIAVAGDGRTRYGTGGEACTGMSALAADRPAW